MSDELPPPQGLSMPRAGDDLIASEPSKVPPTAQESVNQAVDRAQQQAMQAGQAEDNIISYAKTLVSRALEESTARSFIPVTLSYADIDMLARCVAIAEQRSNIVKSVSNQIHARDTALTQKVDLLPNFSKSQMAVLSEVQSGLEKVIQFISKRKLELGDYDSLVMSVKELSKLFLVEDNEKNQG